MEVVIIEDEPQAAQRLERLLKDIDPEINILHILESVKESVEFLKDSKNIKLIFADIQLEDGLSFEIFEQVTVKCPIIFTTAYDQYAIKAFQTNGIGYLLKPIELQGLYKMLEKFEQLTPGITIENVLSMANSVLSRQKKYKSRFVVKAGDKIRSIAIEDIILFHSFEKATFLFTKQKRKYIIDHSLDNLETVINPDHFFRINRNYILSIDTCNDIVSWSSSRLKIKVEGWEMSDVIVARDRYKRFKQWLDQ